MFFKKLTLTSLITITASMHGAAAMSSSSALSNGSTSSSNASTAPATTGLKTPSNLAVTAHKATTTQQMQTVPAATNATDPKSPMADELRRKLIACTTEETSNTQVTEKHKHELSAEQLENLIRLTFRDQNILQLGAPAILDALKRTDQHNWHLARLTILSAILRFTHVRTDEWIIERWMPLKDFSPDYFFEAFNPIFVATALAEAINKRLWAMVNDLLRNEFVLFYLDVETINKLLDVAIDCNQDWLLRRIVNSPILGPQITYETYHAILNKPIFSPIHTKSFILTDLENIIMQSPYFKTTHAAQAKKIYEEIGGKNSMATKPHATWTADDLIAWLNDDARPLSPEMQEWFAYKKVQESIRDLFKNHPNWYRDVDSFAMLLAEFCFFVFLKETKLTKPNDTLKLSEEEMTIAQTLFTYLK